MFICDALRDLVPFAQFKKREQHPWRSDTFIPHGRFSCFFNRKNSTKSRQNVSYNYIIHASPGPI